MRADRLLTLLMLLQRHRRATADWLAEQLEVSPRTVLRDMEALSAAGIPVYTEQGRGGGCVLMEGFTTQASGLTPREAEAIFAWSGRESVAELGLGTHLSSALAKIAATAPGPALEHAETMGRTVTADRRRFHSVEDDVPYLPALRDASARQRRILARYTSSESPTPTDMVLDPAGLVDQSGRWYLVAEREGHARMFRVSRFTAVSVLDEPCVRTDRRPVADIWADLRAAFEQPVEPVDVTLSVTPSIAAKARRLVRMQLAPGSEITVTGRAHGADPAGDTAGDSARDVATGENDDAGRELWHASVRGVDVLAATAVLLAPDLRVVHPPSLVTEILEAATRAHQTYAPGTHHRDA